MAEKAISFSKGQIAVRGQNQTTCVQHKGETLDWFCETCYDVICAKCVSTSHKGHDNILLSEVTPDNKRKIKSFINETEQKELIEIQQEISSTQNSLDERLNHFESVAEEVKKQGKKLKEDIDVLIAETLSQVKHLEEENTKLLTSYKTELEKKLADLKEQLKHCKEALQTGTENQVFDLSKGLQTNIILPVKPKLGFADFTPNNRRNTILKEAFGKVSLRPSEQSQSSTGPDQSDETSVDDNPLPYGHKQSVKRSTDTDQDPEKVLLPQIKILSEWSPDKITEICPKNGGGVWTSDGNKVIHLNSQGEIQQEIQSPVYISDITLSPTTHNLWACSTSYKSVLELTSGELTRRFKTKDKPRCLCITRDEHILVGTKHRITEYTPEGHPGIGTKTYLFKKPMVRSPESISQCPINDNVAVVDRDDEDDSGKDEPAVIVLDRQLKELYRYGESQHYSRYMTLAFRPWDLTYDSQGFLVIADLANKGIHLLSGDGQYLRLLHTDIESPLAVLVDTEGVLWALFGLSNTDQKLKRLQYTSV